MKTIEKDEIYTNLSEFLHNKGIELKAGSYAETIRKSCRIVTDVINLGQQGLAKAKTGIDQKLDQVREVIHKKTAPKPPKAPPKTGASASENGSTGRARPEPNAKTAAGAKQKKATPRKVPGKAPKANKTSKPKPKGPAAG